MKNKECKILKKSSELFLSLGVKCVTMDFVAKSCGVSKKTIYAQFKNKRDLVYKSHMWMVDKVAEIIEQIDQLPLNAIQKILKIYFEIESELAFSQKKESCKVQMQELYEDIYTEIMNKYTYNFGLFGQNNLKQGVKEGLFHNEFPDKILSKLLISMLTNLQDTVIFDQSVKVDLEKITMKYHLYAIATEKGKLEINKLLQL